MKKLFILLATILALPSYSEEKYEEYQNQINFRAEPGFPKDKDRCGWVLFSTSGIIKSNKKLRLSQVQLKVLDNSSGESKYIANSTFEIDHGRSRVMVCLTQDDYNNSVLYYNYSYKNEQKLFVVKIEDHNKLL